MPLDTDTASFQLQEDIFRRMTPEERVRVALEMSESMRSIALAGLRSRQPELSAEELSRQLMLVMYGPIPRP